MDLAVVWAARIVVEGAEPYSALGTRGKRACHAAFLHTGVGAIAAMGQLVQVREGIRVEAFDGRGDGCRS